MSKRNLTNIIAVLLSIVRVYPQFDPYTQVQQPSPEAEKICQNKDVPVNLYTGNINLTIPLFFIENGETEFPISISYNGGGIRVTDESGSVGLGWTLNATGVIGRIVRGMPDDFYDYTNHMAGYERMSSLQMQDGMNDFTEYIELIKHSCQDRDPIALGHPSSQRDLHKTDMISKYQEKYDESRFESSPDNYSFHVRNLSGAFTDIHNNITLQTNSGCGVNHTANGYEIHETNGVKYVFEEIERKEYHYKVGYCWEDKSAWDNKNEYTTDYTSAWWLSRIESTSGDSINFSYTTIKCGHKHRGFLGYTQVKRLHYNDALGICTWQTHNATHSSDYIVNKDSVIHKIINRIDFNAGYVLFYYAPSDSYHSFLPHLDSVNVFARNSSSPVRRFQFFYYGDFGKELLTQLTILGNNQETQTYRFTYYNPLFIPIDSRKYDHWGFYSSYADGKFVGGRYFSEYIDYSGKGRYADNANGTNNMLKTITYPSGGVTTLEWEPHDFSVYSAVGQRLIADNPDSDDTHRIFHTDAEYMLCGKANHELLEQTLTINTSQVVELDFSEYYASATNDYSTCIYDEMYYPTLVITKNNQEVRRIEIIKNLSDKIIFLNLSSGQYLFTLINPRDGIISNCMDYSWIFNLYGTDETLDGKIHIRIGHYVAGTSGSELMNNVGGVRINKIIYKADSSSGYEKTYNYNNEDGSSSGVLAYHPRYGSRFNFCETIFVPANSYLGQAEYRETNCTELVTLRSDGLPFVLNGDGHIGYKRVIECTTEYGNNISQNAINKTIYKFRTADTLDYSDVNDTEWFYDSYVPSDMMQLTSQSYKRGHLLQKTEYTDEIKITDYEYDIQEKDDADTIMGAIFTFADYRNEWDEFAYQDYIIKPYKDLGIVKYRIIPYNKRISQVVTQGSKTNDYHSYTYFNSSYSPAMNANMPATHSTITSEGDTVIQHFTYLFSTNKIKSCVTTKQGKVIDAYRLEYDSLLRLTDKYEALLNENIPSQFSTFNINNGARELVYHYTYFNNRVVEIYDARRDLYTSYLWSYHKAYPIAELVNCSFMELSNTMGDTHIFDMMNAEQPDSDEIANLRHLLPKSHITSRTYSPLIGITSETNPSGRTTYYDYDGLGRLHLIYIIENNTRQILKQYEYNVSQ